MAQQKIGIIMNGVTGRMGTNQHLIRSIKAIREQGGVLLKNEDTLMPDPILIGRNEKKLKALAEAHGIERYSTDLEAALIIKSILIHRQPFAVQIVLSERLQQESTSIVKNLLLLI